MKFLKNLLLTGLIATIGLGLYSCGDDDETVFQPEDPTSEFDARLNSASADSLTATVFLADVDDNVVDVFFTFASDESMRRIYSTVNIQNQGEENFTIGQLTGAEDKADGSLELDSDQSNGFTLNLDLSTANYPSEGTIVYTFWTTTGKGDFRDITKRQASEALVLTVNLSGTNPDAALISQTGIQLFAPTADLMSESFVSTADGVVYDLDEFEFSDLWDIGYTAQGNVPQLSSASGSPQMFFDDNQDLVTFQKLIADSVSQEAAEDLNMVYFSDLDNSFDFDGATTSGDLDNLSVSTSDNQTINIPIDANAELIAFIDQYGKKGVIRISELVDGDCNTTDGCDDNYFESNDYVQIDIKVQP